VIFLILIINATIGIYQDYDAESAMDSLHKMSASHAEVIRDGTQKEVYAKELVPGDIVVVYQATRILRVHF